MTRASDRLRQCTGDCWPRCFVGEECKWDLVGEAEDSLGFADLLDANGERNFGACLLGDRRSDLYSSLFLFFPRFSNGSLRNAASSVHNRCGSPNSSSVPDDEATGGSASPVRSMASISSNGDFSSIFCLGLLGVVVGLLILRDEGGTSHWVPYAIPPRVSVFALPS